MGMLAWIIALLIALLPWIGVNAYLKLRNRGIAGYMPYGWLLIASGITYITALYLPEPTVFDKTSTFGQHMLGGGVISYLYFLYFKKILKWKLATDEEIIVLFALTSTLGVINELVEFAARASGLLYIDGSDVWYDLAANTLGAYTAMACHKSAKYIIRLTR